MATWLVSALKAILPHVGAIISAAAPVFTKKKAEAAANQAQLLQEQIAELQSAASQNAAHIKELAAELQGTLAALEQAAPVVEARVKRVVVICVASALVSVASMGVVLYIAFSR
jgi:hypothetical protein